MNFDQAVFEMSLRDTREIPKVPANIIINFEYKDKKCSASLYAPTYYKDPEGTLATVKRAWGYSCDGEEEATYGITSIEVKYEGLDNEQAKTKNKRISA